MLPCSGRGPGPSCQNGVVHWLCGVGLAGQLLQGPSVALIQHLQTGHIQDLGEGLWEDGNEETQSEKTGLQISPIKGKAEVNLRTRTTEGNLAK